MADCRPLPPDPHDGITLQNDTLGVRIFGPPTAPTLILGKADIWDRRWFADRQPLITLDHIRELAMNDRLNELMPDGNPNNTPYTIYNCYDFPCPKPGPQLIFRTPFAESAELCRHDDQHATIRLTGHGKALAVNVTVLLGRELILSECTGDGLTPADLSVRMYRHRDTIMPGEPVDLSLGDRPSHGDFDPIAMPHAWSSGGMWGVTQSLPADMTFPDGFDVTTASICFHSNPAIESREDETGLGTPFYAEQEGRLDHGTVKRYTPINESPGAATTAHFSPLRATLAVCTTVATSTDARVPIEAAVQWLNDAGTVGIDALKAEDDAIRAHSLRADRAEAVVGGESRMANELILPNLRRPGGQYGDISLCSVAPTKFCFQDAALWHGDFHLNEIRAEPMLTRGEFDELIPYCSMIHALLPQAIENAHDVYDLPGAMYPLVHFPLKCRGVAHTNASWELDLGMNGLVVKPLWLWYRYTGDVDFLRNIAWPVMRETATFCRAYLTEEADGVLHVFPTVSPEHWGITANFERNHDSTSALTLTKYLLNRAAQAARVLGEDEHDWEDAASRLAPYPLIDGESGPIWTDVTGAPHIEYNIPVPLTPIMWGDDVGLDSPPDVLEIAHRTLAETRIWVPHSGYLTATLRPRMGIWNDGAPIPEESLLLSYQSIRIFPAVPRDREIIMRSYSAEGGFRVAARQSERGKIDGVTITSALGGTCTVTNPWGDGPVSIRRSKTVVYEEGTHISFDTQSGEVYELGDAS
jgi:hypothetical protein